MYDSSDLHSSINAIIIKVYIQENLRIPGNTVPSINLSLDHVDVASRIGGHRIVRFVRRNYDVQSTTGGFARILQSAVELGCDCSTVS